MEKIVKITAFFLLFSFSLFAREGEESICRKGNFALTADAIPGPLVSFGELVIGKDQKQISLYGMDFMGKNQHYFELDPTILYGITDYFSVFFSVPVAVSNKIDTYRSSGLKDLIVEFEYALFRNIFSCSGEQMTLVFSTTFPTGSSHKIPRTGIGTMSFFVGVTYNYTTSNWFTFTSYGMGVRQRNHHGLQAGDYFLYQYGLGKNLFNTKNWIFAAIVELDGTFSRRDRIGNVLNPDSGGNAIYATPSLWASTANWSMQLGLGHTIQQKLYGEQSRLTYFLAFDISRVF